MPRATSVSTTAGAAVLVTAVLAVVWVVLEEPGQLVVLPLALVATVLATRRPSNPIGWALAVAAVSFTVSEVGRAWAEGAEPGLGAAVGLWLGEWLILLWTGTVGVLVPLVFPDGRLPSSRWRPVATVAVVAVVVSTVASVLGAGRLQVGDRPSLENPLALPGPAGELLATVSGVGDLVVTACGVVALVGLVVRFRGAHGVQRQQLKVVTAALVLLLVGVSAAALAATVVGERTTGPVAVVAVVGWFTFLIALMFVLPISLCVAVLRYRLFDLDVVIRRSLVYGPLVVVLAATYLGSVLVLGVLLRPVTRESDVAVAASTLAVAALFQPVRRRVRSLVDRRFFRARYDAELTVQSFGASVRSVADLDVLREELVAVVRESVQPEQARLWVRELD